MHKQCTLQKWIAGRLARIIFVDLKKYQPFGDSNIEYISSFIDSATLPQLPWHSHYDLQQALSCKTSKLLRVSAPSAPNNGIGDGISEDVVGVQLSLKPPKFLHVKPQRSPSHDFDVRRRADDWQGSFSTGNLCNPGLINPYLGCLIGGDTIYVSYQVTIWHYYPHNFHKPWFINQELT